MLIFFIILIISILSFATINHNYKRFFVIAVLVLSMMYLFFVPPDSYDLFREYEFLDYIHNLNLQQIFDPVYGQGNRLLSDVQSTSKVYLVYAFLISKLNFHQSLPVLTCLIIYGLAVLRIVRFGDEFKSKRFALAIAFVILLMTLDYRSVSGIRNMLAYSLFAYVAYEDLVNKRNKPLCFICYLLLTQVHMTVAIFLAVRIVLLFSNKVPKWVLMVFALIAFTIRDVLLSVLERFSNNEYINVLLYKSSRYILRYDEGLAQYGYRRVLSYLLFIIAMSVILYYCIKFRFIDKSLSDFALFTMLTIALTVGSIRQYDLFVRNCMLISFLLLPFSISYFDRIMVIKESSIKLIIPNLANKVVAVVSFFAICLTVLYMGIFNAYTFYLPMDGHFSFNYLFS